jgi:uncharacterized protein YdiU (UPF0061 family)
MTASPNGSLDLLRFDNRFTRQLPADPDPTNNRRQVIEACFSRVKPTPVTAPRLVAYSSEMAQLLGLNLADFNSAEFVQRFTDVFSGNHLIDGMDPYAMCYGGHQFGNWAGQLGDGRAINLGEVTRAPDQRWALQLKGAGETPYSRSGDGLAVLRSSIREFLCSEAMFHLGVPTTRALSLIVTGEQVMRDMFYDGNAKFEPGAVVCRVAPSFTRFGNFQIFAARGDQKTLIRLLDYTVSTDFSHLQQHANPIDRYVKMFHEVCRSTSRMVAHWMRVGFVHGVMNTDNMSILGLTIDYGPYGWLEDFDPLWTPNTTDAQMKRYCFGNQPAIAQWNLLQLANAIYPAVGDAKPLQEGLEIAAATYKDSWQTMMAQKLGFRTFDESTDESLTDRLSEILQLAETDMTIFYRALADIPTQCRDLKSDSSKGDNTDRTEGADAIIAPLMDAYYLPDQLTANIKHQIATWVTDYQDRLRREEQSEDQRRQQMNAVNPKFVLRNYLAQLAIDKAEAGDYSMVNQLLEVLRNPYGDQPGNESFAAKRPAWARNRPGCSTLSCSS